MSQQGVRGLTLTDSLCPGSLCLRSEGKVGGLGPGLHQWHRVRHVPRGATWHPARDKLRSVEVISLQPPSVLDCQQSHNYHVSPILRPLPTYITVTVISCVDISICNAEQLCVSGREEPYGDPSDFSQPWSLKWHKRDYDQIMFATGDFKHWMIVSRDDLIGNNDRKYYRNEPILVESSSEQCDPYYCEISIKSESSSCNLLIAARMYRRRGDDMDSWFSIR